MQIEALSDNLTEYQYLRKCAHEHVDPEIYQEPFPHPYILIWLECRRQSGLTGVPAYPEPNKGWMEQDADLMLAFTILEEIQQERQELQRMREEARERLHAMMRQQGHLQ
jgi:predicted thioredoxin/glutaredoxin